MSKKQTVLLVEDDIILVEMYETKLEMEGYRVELAHSGKEALEKLKGKLVPDLILLDILMPDVNGFEVLKEMKKIPDYRSIPVIMLTNLGEAKIDMNQELIYALGVRDYLIKSRHTPDEVVEKIRKVLPLSDV
ncbi:TPA: response regulator [candidate division CPR2 bacterium]|uniref:DNA-binding response regulator, two-component system, OmpR family, response regulator RpaB n=1 Tax=candidate division CPR2 bacterium GW2011_GWC1_41_48 TaxID=1618344 RepID=A0A0G0WCS0_UNCC2|nr:MAG: Response regulator receiver protein [candidate division CPR2 bacterium GW2011_GWC2_39_35]KKR28879.1 MAG: Response regulator receiver protein [candidate division CPR2 bacterium GW2011_GWD1_39_7]KKR29148.1 MAG: Response regulator receiver protein [candidate division CPR2 bacterium GW2011_GWD2_39_7]KKS09862.1 MAG: DNA-binding response regulator, two-component system, OmpR family, response regulator RpaB [candidate division CPR2 bacterium GW2011_GWC1_41_48]OGB61507.1 MAG: hypothetical prote